MDTKIIERYINFSIDNGYNLKIIHYDNLLGIIRFVRNHYPNGDTIDLIRLITSKEFIESIARGIEVKMGEEWEDKYLYLYKGVLQNYNAVIDKITTEQAFAIRNNKLEEFIKIILPNK